MQTQLKLTLTKTLFLCFFFFFFFVPFSLSDPDEHNQMETVERLLREASNTLVTFLENEGLTTQQQDALSAWNKLIVTSLASLGQAQYVQILNIVNTINRDLPGLKLSAKNMQTITDNVNEIKKEALAMIKDEVSKLKARPRSKN